MLLIYKISLAVFFYKRLDLFILLGKLFLLAKLEMRIS